MAVRTGRGGLEAGDFVGRDDEVRLLESVLDATIAGRSRLVLIGGEPGIGKSRLVDEFVRAARGRNARVLWAKCWEEAGAPAYWPWIQLLRAYVRIVGMEQAREEMGAGAADIASMLPDLRDRFDDLSPAASDSDSARFRLFDSTTAFLRAAATSQPLVLVLDDLHAADTPSIALLRFVASQLGDTPILTVGTFRDVELSPDHPLTAAIGDLLREPTARLITLAGLPRESVGGFIATAAGRSADAQLVAALWRETRGNPLFMGEAARLLASEGRLDDIGSARTVHLTVPANIRDVIVRRARRLGDETVDALTIGAALGPEFDLEVLARVRGTASGDTNPITTAAVADGLLAPVTGAGGRLRFTHDVVRESMYAEIAPLERARLHLRIATTLEEVFADAIEAHLAELAHHHAEAAGVGDPAIALGYARRAGDQAARSLAYEEAARLYRMALEALDAAQPTHPSPRIEIMLALGEAEARGGDLAAARATYGEAAELARKQGAVRELAVAALGAGGRLPWARPGRDTGLIPLLQDALMLLGGADEQLRVRLLTRLACAWRSSPERRGDSDALSAQAVAAARALGEPYSLAVALAGRFYATWWPESTDGRVELAREAVAAARAAGDGELIVDATLTEAMALVDAGRVGEGRALIEGVGEVAERLRQPSQLWLGTAPGRLLALGAGEFAKVEHMLEMDGTPSGHSITPADDNVSTATMHRFILARERGGLSDVEPAVRAAARDLPWYPVHRAALACLLIESDRSEEARPIFDELARDEFHDLYPDNEWLLGMSLASEACVGLHDAVHAQVLYEQLLPYAGRHAVGHPEATAGAVDRYLGLLAIQLGRDADAEAHLRHAIRLNDEMGLRVMASHARAELARLLHERADAAARAESDRLTSEALAAVRQLGMTVLAEGITVRQTPADVPVGPIAGGDSSLTRDGDTWAVRYAGSEFRLTDAKGLAYLARLLAAPGREILALDLARESFPAATPARDGELVTNAGPGDAGAMLDDQAKEEYRRRLTELETEVAESESWNDPARAEAARQEIEFLTDEISRAVGLGGRDRRAASAAERARVSVTRALRLVIDRIGRHSPELAEHLNATIHTGMYCVYRPDPSVPHRWRV